MQSSARDRILVAAAERNDDRAEVALRELRQRAPTAKPAR